MNGKMVIYTMMAIQLIAWGWHQWRAGKLNDKNYIIFCLMMLSGQLGAGIECLQNKAWGTLVVQTYFFFWTAFGAVQRWRQKNS